MPVPSAGSGSLFLGWAVAAVVVGSLLRLYFSALVGVIAAAAVLLFGVIAAALRYDSGHIRCAKCGSASLVPLDSPVGQELLLRYHNGSLPRDAEAERMQQIEDGTRLF